MIAWRVMGSRAIPVGVSVPAVVCFALAALTMGSCRRRVMVTTAESAVMVPASVAPLPTVEEVQPPSPQDLLPGEIVAYGLTMPIGTVPRLNSQDSRIFYVDASMTRVMRYLQRRLVFSDADIHPLGALIRSARVSETGPNAALVVDVGVRDEGDRTFVTVWNRTPATTGTTSLEDGFRAAGVDPNTGRALPQYNN